MTETLIESDDVAVVADATLAPAPPSLAREVWPRDDAKLAFQAMKLFARYGLSVALVCGKCQQPLRIDREVAAGDVHFLCACTARIQAWRWA